MDWKYISNMEGNRLSIYAVLENDEEMESDQQMEIEEVGYLYAELQDNVIYFQEIGVAEEYRRNGIATGMIDYLVRMNNASFALPISLCYCVDEFTEAFHALMSGRRDFLMVEDGTEYVYPVQNIFKSELVQRIMKSEMKDCHLKLIKELTKQQIGEVAELLKSREIPFEVSAWEIEKEYDNALSGVCLNRNSEVTAALFVSHSEDAVFFQLACIKNNDVKDMVFLFRRFFTELEKYMDAPLFVNAINDKSAKICEKFVESGIADVRRNPIIIGTYMTDVFSDLTDSDID